MQSSLGERREEQIRPRQAPDNRPLRPRSDPCREKCGRRAVNRSGSAASKFMKCSDGQAATRQDAIDLADTERKAARFLHALSLYGRDTFAQISKDLISQDSRHRSRNPFRSRWLEMTTSCRLECLMFSFCSFVRAESSRSILGISSHSVSVSADFPFESAC